MTLEKFKMLKRGNKIKVKNFSSFWDGKVVTIASVGSTSYNPCDGEVEPEVVTEYVQHNCACGCKGSSRLALHHQNVELID